jgi:hypothetical protein
LQVRLQGFFVLRRQAMSIAVLDRLAAAQRLANSNLLVQPPWDESKNASIAPLTPTSAPKTHNSAEVFTRAPREGGSKRECLRCSKKPGEVSDSLFRP